MPQNIYRDNITGRYFKKLKAGTGRFTGMYLWRPVRRFIKIFYISTKQTPFWLDDQHFEPVNSTIT